MKKIFILKSIIVIIILLSMSWLATGPMLAEETEEIESNSEGVMEWLNKVAKEGGFITAEVKENTIITAIAQIVQVILVMLAVLFLILLIHGGFLWMTARGNEEQVKKAREVIAQAAIGIIIVFAAYAITDFVLRGLMRAVGINITSW